MTVARPAGAQRFMFQGIDPATGSVNVEALVFIEDIAAVRRIIGEDADHDSDLRRSYELEPAELAAVGALCRPTFAPDAMFTRFERWSPLNDVPYLVHTNFELPLMLDGVKPLAVFGDAYPGEWFDEYLAPFEPHVQSGRIIRRVVDKPMPELKARRSDLDGIRTVYFALPGHEWRIDAYIEMYQGAQQSGWDDGFERRQGSLLGYEEWQNDWWLKHRGRLAR
jgi:hypothetical protein